MGFLLRLLASMPAGLSYGLAWLAYGLLYHALRYRRSTVRENLAHAFPERSAAERAGIERASYRHLCNLFFEILRASRMRREEFQARVRFPNPEVLKAAMEGPTRQAIVLLIHQGNWEWTLHSAMPTLDIAVDPVYKPLHSPFWEDFMREARSRFGAQPMAVNRVGREVIRGRNRRRLIAIVADQTGPRDGGYWTDFLNRPASFYRGPDKLARSLDLPLLFAQCRRTGTGHYEIIFHEISRPPHPTAADALLDRYIALAERFIAEQPETYLWTNRRWKKAPPEHWLRSKTQSAVSAAAEMPATPAGTNAADASQRSHGDRPAS